MVYTQTCIYVCMLYHVYGWVVSCHRGASFIHSWMHTVAGVVCEPACRHYSKGITSRSNDCIIISELKIKAGNKRICKYCGILLVCYPIFVLVAIVLHVLEAYDVLNKNYILWRKINLLLSSWFGSNSITTMHNAHELLVSGSEYACYTIIMWHNDVWRYQNSFKCDS